jgi:hypothetical protein
MYQKSSPNFESLNSISQECKKEITGLKGKENVVLRYDFKKK